MKLAAFGLLSLLSPLAFAQEPAHITIFREKASGSRFTGGLQMGAGFGTYAPPNFIFKMFIDGTDAAHLQPGHFVTFDVPAGRHEVRTNRSQRLILDLKPGERAFIRPVFHNNGASAPEVAELVRTCSAVDAYLENKPAMPLKPKNVKFGDVAQENAFPACSDSSIVHKAVNEPLTQETAEVQ
jgi:hypothetical protein